MTDDEVWEKAQLFAKEFRDLVRKHAGTDFMKANETSLLHQMQDATSVFSPWIWSD